MEDDKIFFETGYFKLLKIKKSFFLNVNLTVVGHNSGSVADNKENFHFRLHGCYAVLDGGNLSDALVDFTSGVSEVISLKSIISHLRADPEAKKGRTPFYSHCQ